MNRGAVPLESHDEPQASQGRVIESGAVDLALAWTVEAANDIDAVQVDPYWTSRVNALAIIGYSAAAGAVLLVLAYRDLDGDLHGMTAWPATGRALRLYTEGRTS